MVFAFFPFAGLVGAALAGVSLYVLRLLGMSIFFAPSPYLSCSYFHQARFISDGFADTCDALFSRRDRRAQLEIMRDPHIGVYAVVGTVLLLSMALAAWTVILATGRTLLAFASLLYGVFGRSLSGLYSASLPSARREGMQYAFRQKMPRKVRGFLVVILLLSTLAVVATAHWSGVIAVMLSFLFFLYFCRFFRKGIRRCDGRSRRVPPIRNGSRRMGCLFFDAGVAGLVLIGACEEYRRHMKDRSALMTRLFD